MAKGFLPTRHIERNISLPVILAYLKDFARLAEFLGSFQHSSDCNVLRDGYKPETKHLLGLKIKAFLLLVIQDFLKCYYQHGLSKTPISVDSPIFIVLTTCSRRSNPKQF